jgi:ubiquinone biosynthesis protein UbiJ
VFADKAFVEALNHVLRDSPWARERLAPHAGDLVCIEAGPLRLATRIDTSGCFTPTDDVSDPSVRIGVPLAELPLALANADLGRVMNRVRIDGNAELAETLGFVFRNLEWDVEEDIARVVGDAPAHRIAGTARAVHAAGLRGLEAVGGNVGEYLTEESGLLMRSTEIEGFGAEISALRDSVARLEKRIRRLDPEA